MGLLSNIPIKNKLIRTMMIIAWAVTLLSCTGFIINEFFSFRSTMLRKLETMGRIIAANSTAALAFDSREDCTEILSALKTEPSVTAAGLFDRNGSLFCHYSSGKGKLPLTLSGDGFELKNGLIIGFQPVVQGDQRLGTLYIQSDLRDLYTRIRSYSEIVLIVIVLATLMAYLLSKILQKSISGPILDLAGTADIVSKERDYAIRAVKHGEDELGKLTSAFNHMLDQIQAQNKALKDFNRELEDKVQERTKSLEIANKELESFSYSVSHDLRAPVRAINGYVKLFEEAYGKSVDEEANRLIGNITKNAHRMGLLIDDLLEFSRISRREINKTEFSMQKLVTEIWEELTVLEKERKIEFSLGKLPNAYGERKMIAQVWQNLISNALKYSRNSDPARIEIFSGENDREVFYGIRDNGAGFNMEYYHKLFEVFQRLHSHDEFEGTGVGLAIVQRVIERHGGKLWAESQEDAGSTFYFTLESAS